ncbi:uncharacterized protein BO80DRAFT_500231 [Aspergillus ibericus CBS 121593]|uniref:Uncharacterized protein n=1 Tax=Aspergillus ibericus CBS 121593 TaxID=1448316 RepID=A0A395H8C1_9EURO|nr:hypothetical protein BO80DRAFT_500231 [Aspergillus ibericus CBS 121593]RAL03395.1 hypothetical protein BO80DRAFT_500231 [Aspergillus ibericus CBS 121593]
MCIPGQVSMKRRESFCTSELPCFVESLDSFFCVSRTGGNIMGPEIRRTRSADPVLPCLPQVDGSAEKRKVKKGKAKKKSNKKGKSKNKGKSAVVVAGGGGSGGGGSGVEEGVVVVEVVQTEEVTVLTEDGRGGEDVGTAGNGDGDAGDAGVMVEEEVKESKGSPPSYASVAGDEIVDEKTAPESPGRTPSATQAACLKERILAALSISRDGPQSQRRVSSPSDQAGPSGVKGARGDVEESSPRVQSGGSSIDNDRPADNASVGEHAAADENHTASNPNPDPFASHADDSSEGTVHITGAGDDKGYSHFTAYDREALLFCHVHGRQLCRFDPSCCVHRPLADCGCPPRQSCCCLHHNGDCCSCLTTREDGPARSGVETPSHTGQAVGDGDVVAESNTAGAKKNMDDKFIGVDTLSTHFLQLYEKRDLCDFHILLKSSNGMFQPVMIPVHVAVLARSPFISALLQTPIYRQGHREIVAVLGDQVNLIHGFEHAVRNLYGSPLLQGERLRSAALAVLGYAEESQGMYPFPINIAMIDLAFSYAASGAFLQVNSILEAGVRMALNLVDWDTVEPIFHFGLCVDDFSIFLEGTVTPPDPVPDNQRHISTRSRELREIWAPLLVRAALSFIVDNIDPQFVLYPHALSMCIPNRIPEYLTGAAGIAPKSVRSVPNNLPRREVVITSSVLLNLPYIQLKEVFRVLAARRVLSNDLAQAIIVEREARRLQGLRALARQGDIPDPEIPREVRELGHQELLVSRSVYSETQGPGTVTMEITLEREWTGLVVSDTLSHTLSPK